jgi:hypothetical protein
MIKATLIGIVTLIISIGLGVVLIFLILPIVNPTPPLCSEKLVDGCVRESGFWAPNALHNVFEFLVSFICLYFLSICIASFTSGFYIQRWTKHIVSSVFYSFTSCLIIGIIGPVLFLGHLVIAPYAELYERLSWIMIILAFGLLGGISGLIGYMVGYYANRRKVSV